LAVPSRRFLRAAPQPVVTGAEQRRQPTTAAEPTRWYPPPAAAGCSPLLDRYLLLLSSMSVVDRMLLILGLNFRCSSLQSLRSWAMATLSKAFFPDDPFFYTQCIVGFSLSRCLGRFFAELTSPLTTAVERRELYGSTKTEFVPPRPSSLAGEEVGCWRSLFRFFCFLPIHCTL